MLSENSIENIKYDFGDYVLIEQKRYGCDNEMYLHKVIGNLRSNSYVDVPVQSPVKETVHKKVVDVVACVCCSVYERDILRYKKTDLKPNTLYNVNKYLDKVITDLLMGLTMKDIKYKQYYLESALKKLVTDNWLKKAKKEFDWHEGQSPLNLEH